MLRFIVVSAMLSYGLYWVKQTIARGKARSTAGKRQRKVTRPETEPGPAARPAHEVLGVARSASPSEISAAYKKLVAAYHPDKVATSGSEIRELAETRLREINAAYAELSKSA